MGQFLDHERPRQAAFKATWPGFSAEARRDGVYSGRPRPFCLPEACAEENLVPEIRDSIMAYFAREEIKWHNGRKPAPGVQGKPSNHLCGSQVCCANFLFPFASNPVALAALLRPLYPELRKMLPMEGGDQVVSMEWIGLENYLGETNSRNGKRPRGALFTSADAAVMFEGSEGIRQIVLIEWKYTEAYSPRDIRIADSGTDRGDIYRHLYERADFPLDKGLLPGYGALFYEPFYQLFRQQLLANEMEKARELGAGRVSTLHIAPARNADFPRVTSPALEGLGDSVTEVWRRLVRAPDRFGSVSTEALFGRFPIGDFPELRSWWEYITARYPWVHEDGAADGR